MGLNFKYRRYVSGNWAKPLREKARIDFEGEINLQLKDLVDKINESEGYILAYYSDDGNSILNWVPVNLSPEALEDFNRMKK
jgi:hypothetical protein